MCSYRGLFMCFVLVYVVNRHKSLASPCDPPGPKDCQALIYLDGGLASGVYRIWPDSWPIVGSFEVFCDMTTEEGGWTLIQRRGNYNLPKDLFYKTWNEYKNGFGSLENEFWIGNDRIFALTNQDAYELRIDMWDVSGNHAYAKYAKFWIENESQLYRIQISRFSSPHDIGDSFGGTSGLRFTTKDSDNDALVGLNCANSYKGGWWYSACHFSNLNGLNLQGNHTSYADGITWKTWMGYHHSLSRVEMKIRPIRREHSPSK